MIKNGNKEAMTRTPYNIINKIKKVKILASSP